MSARRRSRRPRRPRGKYDWTVDEARKILKPGRKRAQRLAILIIVVIVIIAIDRFGPGSQPTGDLAKYDGKNFVVVAVIDGDTLDLDVPDGDSPKTRVRLWGIDAPELAKHWEGETADEPGARQAKALLTELAAGKTVTLDVLDHRIRGSYGRLLAFVALPDGVGASEALISSGWAEADDRWWHPRLDAFEMLEQSARRKGLGIWAREKSMK